MILIAVILVVVTADAISTNGAPLRSLVYFPIGIAVIVARAFPLLGAIGRYFLITICCLAIIGNSQINNHLFASSASAEFKDRMLATTIISDVRNLIPDYSPYHVLKVEVIGNKSWPATGIQSKSETFGASFFEWDGGNRNRVAAYLSLNGIACVAASNSDRARIYKLEKAIPAWPHEGWVSVHGDILVLKFGDYSMPQKASLCAQGIAALCN